MYRAVVFLFLAGTLFGATGTLASEPFSGVPGALQASNTGSGWAGGWQVQNSSTSVPGYNVASGTPLNATSGTYAIGGNAYLTAGRPFDTSTAGPFAAYVRNGLIGQSGQSMYFGLLMRSDLDTNDEMSVTLHPGTSPAWWVNTPGVSVGYFGGTRFWSLKLNGTVYRTAVPVVTGQAAWLVVDIEFNNTNTVNLYVNPSTSALPAAPAVRATTTKSLAFASLAYYGGSGTKRSSIDEINFAGSYAALTGAVTPPPPPPPVVPPTGVALGTNLSSVADYSRELPFVDVFKMARTWISQAQGASWGQGPALALDANGWITSLQPGQYAETILLDNALDDHADYPTGLYTLLYDGQGTIAFDLQSASIVSQTPGRMVVNVPAGNGIFLMVTATNPANPLRNIRFLMPGAEATYQTQPFNPVFLQRLQGYKVLRFMEWMLTNGSQAKLWSDRATPADYTWTWRGVPLETVIQLANALKLKPWFNIPAQASDDYVAQFAALVNSKLDPTLAFYLEYSNETWNGGFSQNAYVKNQGTALGLSTDPTLAGAYYTSFRSLQIFNIFKAALATPSRMVRVIASQAANSWLSDQTLSFSNAFAQADALAIAPYFNCDNSAFGGFAGMLGDPATATQVAAMTVDQLLDVQQAQINGCTLQQMQSSAAVAQKYRIKLIGYEGGQSLAGFFGAENNSALTTLFKAANRNARMGTLYTQYLQNWVNAGGDLFVHFTDVTAYTRYGSWGALEYQGQDPATSPKYSALMTFSAAHQ